MKWNIFSGRNPKVEPEHFDEVYNETCKYFYRNPILRWITLGSHDICHKLRKNKGKGVLLDIGCGHGDSFPREGKERVVGLDKSLSRLRTAKDHHPEVTLLCGDMYNLPYRSNSIDTIVSVYVLEHIHVSLIPRVLDEVLRVLKAAGEFVMAVPTWEGLTVRIGRKVTSKRYIEKKYGIDYDAMCREEHVTSSREVLRQLRMRFHVEQVVWFPFRVPTVHLNASLIARCVKR